jgi:hypothetical protein
VRRNSISTSIGSSSSSLFLLLSVRAIGDTGPISGAMADGLDRWRDFFRGAGVGICEVIEKAVLVAAADEPQEFLRRRDRIAERLFNALHARPSCHGCTGSTVSQPPATPAVAEDKGSVRRVPEKDSKVDSSSLGAPLPLVGHASHEDDEQDSDSDSEDDERLRRAAASNYGHNYDDDNEEDEEDEQDAAAAAEEEDHHPHRQHEEDDQEAEELEALTNEIDQESQAVGEVLRIKELLSHKEDYVCALLCLPQLSFLYSH